METLTQIATVIIALYILGEVAALVYILKNKSKVAFRAKYALRNLLGLDNDSEDTAMALSSLYNKVDVLDRKMNYVGRHIKFEREQLRKLGILKDSTQASNKAQLKQ